jgi:hypothetical protein
MSDCFQITERGLKWHLRPHEVLIGFPGISVDCAPEYLSKIEVGVLVVFSGFEVKQGEGINPVH